MDKINLNIITDKDGFEKLSDEEVETLISKITTDVLEAQPDETTPGKLKVEILNKLADKLGGKISISTIETICAFINYLTSQARGK